jgi:hypothetical protein
MLLDPKDQEELYRMMFWIGFTILTLAGMALFYLFEIH